MVGRPASPAVLAIGVAASSLGLTAGTAFASISTKHVKSGSTRTKSEVNQTITVGKTKLTCQEITLYEWESNSPTRGRDIQDRELRRFPPASELSIIQPGSSLFRPRNGPTPPRWRGW